MKEKTRNKIVIAGVGVVALVVATLVVGEETAKELFAIAVEWASPAPAGPVQ